MAIERCQTAEFRRDRYKHLKIEKLSWKLRESNLNSLFVKSGPLITNHLTKWCIQACQKGCQSSIAIYKMHKKKILLTFEIVHTEMIDDGSASHQQLVHIARRTMRIASGELVINSWKINELYNYFYNIYSFKK
jgi:hypothetical protein